MTRAFITSCYLLLLSVPAWGQVTQERTTSDAAQPVLKDETQQDSIYLRVLRNDKDDPIAMQTSIVSFTQKGDRQGVVVDLIGAVHVADREYFHRLNQLFKKYETVLYELVAPKDNNIPEGGSSRHPIGQMQQGMKSMLKLSYQLEEIDYTKRNFVHADMSPEEFARVMGERGESWVQMMFKMMGSAIAMQASRGGTGDADLLFAFLAKDRARRLKRVMSTQFRDLEGTMGVLEGEDGSTIIGERNKKALEVLRTEIARGKKRIAIFYGAGHFPNMEERLAKDFGFFPNKKSIRWLTAWDMK